jgi:NADH:ubiquinone oxidoreductase subunit F (NADH-binding)
MTGPGLPRLLAGVQAGRPVGLAEHRSHHGIPEEAVARGDELVDAVAAAGLRGRGGAGFPTAVKLRAVADARGRKALVVNGTEGEPMSAKDRVLLSLAPHLVLDGVRLAADAVGARQIVIAVTTAGAAQQAALQLALQARPDLREARVVAVPDGYLSGEESALLRSLNGGPAKPTTVPPRPYQRGLRRRPTLVSNAETLAQLALIARHGPDWFRALGPPEHPGSALVTLGGAAPRPGVVELVLGTPAEELVGAPRALLVGGYHGTWLSGENAAVMTLDDASLATAGASLGAGVLFALPDRACPVGEVARVMRWLERQGAGQCGPCIHGLDAIATTVEALADGVASAGDLDDLRRWCRELPGRGACHHPDGAVRFLRSALDVFADEWDDHRRRGPCDACDLPPLLAVPRTQTRLVA